MDAQKRQRHEYYLKRKAVINQKARDRYKEKRLDPEFYKNMLQKNQDSYHRKTNQIDVTPWTPEQEEAFFIKVTRDIKANHEKDKNRPTVLIDYMTTHHLFYENA